MREFYRKYLTHFLENIIVETNKAKELEFPKIKMVIYCCRTVCLTNPSNDQLVKDEGAQIFYSIRL